WVGYLTTVCSDKWECPWRKRSVLYRKHLRGSEYQPLRGWDPFAGFTQGSRGRQPWAGRRNPFGVGNLFAGLPRVAADGNPGLDDATPSGLGPFCGLTQGSRGRQPWAGRRNPFGVGNLLIDGPRVAADGNPGLDDATPSGLEIF